MAANSPFSFEYNDDGTLRFEASTSKIPLQDRGVKRDHPDSREKVPERPDKKRDGNAKDPFQMLHQRDHPESIEKVPESPDQKLEGVAKDLFQMLHKRGHPDSKEKVPERPDKKQGNGKDLFQMLYQALEQISEAQQSPEPLLNLYGDADQFSADLSSSSYHMGQPQYSLYPMNQWVTPMEDISSNNMSFNPTSAVPVSTAVDMSSVTGTVMNSVPPHMRMSADGSVYSRVGKWGGKGNYYMFQNQEHLSAMPSIPKETITFTKSVWYPPNPAFPPPSLRDKPDGCKTIFIGGLPEKTTEEILREVFEQFGEIVSIRINKRNYCHIRYTREVHVKRALYLSGFRMKIGDKSDAPYSGRIHVDYASARDDQYEYECAQRAAERIARHRAAKELKMKETKEPPIPEFSERRLDNLLNEFRSGRFKGGVQTLVSWLEKGQVNKRNGGIFYSIIHCLNHRVRRSLSDDLKCEDEFNETKSEFQKELIKMCSKFNSIEKVYEAATCQKVFFHFSKFQRRGIELWKKVTFEVNKANSEDLKTELAKQEKHPAENKEKSKELHDKLKYEERSKELQDKLKDLQKRLHAARWELEKTKSEKDKTLNSLNQNLELVSKKLIESRKEVDEYRELWAAMSGNAKNETIPDCKHNSTSKDVLPWIPYRTPSGVRVSVRDVRLIVLLSVFLNQYNAPIDFIHAYLLRVDASVTVQYLEHLLRLFPSLFQETTFNIGDTLQRNWTFLGFNCNPKS